MLVQQDINSVKMISIVFMFNNVVKVIQDNLKIIKNLIMNIREKRNSNLIYDLF